MPTFRKPIIGLDISDHSVEAVWIAREGEVRVVASYGRILLPPGLVVNGEIVDAGKLAGALRELLDERMAPALPKGPKRVAFALPESQVFMHVFEVPFLADERALGASLALEADAYFPYPHEELSAGYAVIAQRPDRKDVYYAAVRTSVLDAYRALFASVGALPVLIEAESAAIARAALDRDERDPAALVDIGARVTEISVYDRDGIQFSETIDAAGDAFTAALAEAEGLTPEAAEKAKQERGIVGVAEGRGDRALRRAVEDVFDRVRSAIAFHEEKSGRSVGRILLCGGSAAMPGLLERASEIFGAGPVVMMADPWKSARPGGALDAQDLRAHAPLLLTAIGLGLRGAGVRKFPEIDFLAAAPKPHGRQARSRGRILAIAAGAAVFSLLAAGAWFGRSRVFGSGSSAPSPATHDVPAAAIALRSPATMAASFSEADRTLAGTPIDLTFSATATFSHAATATDAKAEGSIEIVNETGTAHTLIAATRFLSPGGVLFRLDRAVPVPAHGRVSAPVTADLPGAQGDIPPGRFTIPGLPEPLQAAIYGEARTAMTGGVAYAGAPYGQEERDAAIAAFRSQAEAEAALQAARQAGSGRVAPSGLIAVDPLDIQGLPAVGLPIGDYVLRADVKARAYLLDRAQVERLLGSALDAELGGDGAGAYVIGSASMTVERFDPDAGTAALELTATARRR